MLLTAVALSATAAEPWEDLVREGLAAKKRGDVVAAERLYTEGLAAARTRYGARHDMTVIPLLSLADLFLTTNRAGDCERLANEALSISKESRKPDKVANATLMLAKLYHMTGRLSLAEKSYRTLLGFHERTLGKDHLEVAGDLNLLGQLVASQKRDVEARALFLRALGTLSRTKDDVARPLHAAVLVNLGDLQARAKQFKAAEKNLRKAIGILEVASPGPTLGEALNSLAVLNTRRGRFRSAEPLFHRALDLTQDAYGSSHPQTKRILRNYSAMLSAAGRVEESRAMAGLASGN